MAVNPARRDRLTPVYFQGQDTSLDEPDHYVDRGERERLLGNGTCISVLRGKALLRLDTCLPLAQVQMDQSIRGRQRNVRDESCTIGGPCPQHLSTPERPRYSIMERYMLDRFNGLNWTRAVMAVNGWKPQPTP